MSKDKKKKKRLKIVIVSILLGLVIFNFSTWAIYFYMRKTLDNEIGNRLLNIGKVALLKIDSKIFTDKKEETNIEIKLIKNYFKKIIATGNIEDIYIVDKNYNVVLEPKDEWIKNISHSYIEKDKNILKNVWIGKEIFTEIYEIKGSYFKNAYLPIIDNNTISYLLCLEASAETLKIVENLKLVLFSTSFISIFFAGIFAFYLGKTLQDFAKMEEELRIREKFALMGQVSANVAHEIRNPLGIIKGAGEILKKRYKEEDLVQYVNEEIERINHLINEFLTLSKDIVLNKQNVDINSLITSIINHIPVNEKIKIIPQLKENIPEIEADSEKLRQVFLNIIINAIESIKDKGEVIITSCVDKKNVIVIISDTGAGIEKDNIKKIFLPFFTTKQSGIGVGLSTAQAIIQAHGGDMEVESKFMEGSRFIIKLPWGEKL
ncbi:GHKL domain-containing protein [Candidatus Desantisbacteria bacterium]|nr:GHKL domain-containing protein [Candidatus Desantisbacteria bacterium]